MNVNWATYKYSVWNFHTHSPAQITRPIRESTADHAASFDLQKAIKVGDTLPSFKLSDAFGNEVSSSTLLAKGPLLVNFYRGEWCPFCNLSLRALQKHLSEFESKGVTLVAITCEVPKQALSTTEKNELKFPVLSDLGTKYARELGLLFPMPYYMRPVFDIFGVDFKARNRDDSFVLPVPATLLVDQKGVVRNAFVEPEYHKRAEPESLLG
ncbi:thioredoxin-like protein [Cadophora sp. MPI-SDFR-AT-0126]|nr:thioredoxin-like protein [Leotiomycetes sp. MPI-SDFR-AT-0126]